MFTTKLDWLSFTFKSSPTFVGPEEFDYFLDAFPEIDALWEDGQYIKDLGKSRFYDHNYEIYKKIRIAYRVEQFSGIQFDRNMGVNVTVSGSSLEWFFKLMHYDLNNIPAALSDLKKRGCSFSRLDFAYDDYDMILKPSDFASWWLSGQIVSDFRYCRFINSNSFDGGCFYMGKRSADRMMRIYDKNFESQGSIPAIRYEFEYHGSKTPDLVAYIEKNGLPSLDVFLEDFILNVVVGSNESKDNTKARRPSLDRWIKFLECIESSFNAHMPELGSVTLSKDTKDQLTRSTDWVFGFTLKTIKSMCVIYGEDLVFEAIKASELSSKHDILKALFDADPGRYKEPKTKVCVGSDFTSFW